jgi:UDP-glucuronate 4-epimerase
MWRDWTHVDDVCDGVIRAMLNPLGYEIINIGRGEPVKMLDFVSLMERVVGGALSYNNVDAPATESLRTCADVTKARELLGYDPKICISESSIDFLKSTV